MAIENPFRRVPTACADGFISVVLAQYLLARYRNAPDPTSRCVARSVTPAAPETGRWALGQVSVLITTVSQILSCHVWLSLSHSIQK